MATRILIIGLALLLAAGSACAETYFSLGGMWVDLRSADLKAGSEEDRMTFDNGWGGLFALGQEIENLRLEVEAAYRRNDIDDISGTALDGKYEAMSAMLNGYLTLDVGPFHPFIGAGGGRARIEQDLRGGGEERDDVFAWQGMIGLTFPLQPGGFDIGYRYFATDEPEFDGLRSEYESHNAYIAFRF